MQKAQRKRSASFFIFERSSSAFRFCLLIFVWCLLLLPVRAQTDGRINLNTAPVEELMRLPYVGQAVANRILEYRRKHGPFKRPQDVIIIKGLSANRYRHIAHLIRI
jgi:competence ComEA-like helix-hairpin-helix protein